MEKHGIVIYIVCLALLSLTACSGKKDKKEDIPEKGMSTVLPDRESEVLVVVLKKRDFYHELVSNGKAFAKEKADLRFESSEMITCIYVKNGDRVRKGQKLAELDKFRLKNKRMQAETTLEKARLNLQDVLIGQGYAMEDSVKVPAETMKLAKVKSGYEQSKSEYELAKCEEEHATLVAPFDGIVANLFAKPYNMAVPSEVFCSVMNMQEMEVDFNVLESELPLLKEGDKAKIIPYADASSGYEGSVSEVNPLVDDKGMVKIRVQVKGNGKLFNGMNVRVVVQRSLGKRLVIPKKAIVLRSGKQVVFTLKDNRAQWNYVHTGFENTDSCVVSEKMKAGVSDGLQEGDTVIVGGNVNLAHETPVKVIGQLDN